MNVRPWIIRHRATLGTAVLLFLLPYLVFWQVWLPLANPPLLFEQGDFVEQNVAMRQFVAGEFREGRLPLWDPYTYAGQPALSGTLFAPYYPLGWWQTLFPFPFPNWVLPVEVIVHLGIGGFGTFLLVRRLTENGWAALFSGVTFQLSGWATGYPMLQVGILETAVWLPWGLWLIERGMAQKSWRAMAGVALVYGVALLAGHPQTLMYLAYLSTAYFGYRAYHYRVGWRFLMGAGSLIALGVLGMGAAQWLPAIEAYQYSPRLDLSYAEVGNGFRWADLTGMLIPVQEGWSPLYIGQLAFMTAFIALVKTPPKEIRFWGIVAVIALMLSLGSNGWLYPIAYRLLPGFAIFRNQERIALLFTMAMVVLSGYGWHFWTSQVKGDTQRLIFQGFSLIALFFTLSFTRFTKILDPIPNGYYPPSSLVAYLHSIGNPTWRISSEGLLPDGPNAGMVYRVRDVVGNSPLHLAALDEFVETVPELRWWEMLNIQHLLTTRTFPENAPLIPVIRTNEGTLYQVFVNATPLWITHEYVVVPSQSAAIARTAAPDFNPRQTAVLEQAPAIEPAPTVGNELFNVTHFEPQRLVTELNLAEPAIVVWSEIAYPGWVARVNGVEAEPLRAYGLLRALALPSGVHTVEWRFEPPLAYGGLEISSITVITLLGIMGNRLFPRLKMGQGTGGL